MSQVDIQLTNPVQPTAPVDQYDLEGLLRCIHIFWRVRCVADTDINMKYDLRCRRPSHPAMKSSWHCPQVVSQAVAQTVSHIYSELGC